MKVIDLSALGNLTLDEIIEKLSGSNEHFKWYNELTDKIVKFGQAMIDHGFESPQAKSLYDDICFDLTDRMPLTFAGQKELDRMRRVNNEISGALLCSLVKTGEDMHTFTFDEVEAATAKYAGVIVGFCPEHGIHADLLPHGKDPSQHVH